MASSTPKPRRKSPAGSKPSTAGMQSAGEWAAALRLFPLHPSGRWALYRRDQAAVRALDPSGGEWWKRWIEHPDTVIRQDVYRNVRLAFGQRFLDRKPGDPRTPGALHRLVREIAWHGRQLLFRSAERNREGVLFEMNAIQAIIIEALYVRMGPIADNVERLGFGRPEGAYGPLRPHLEGIVRAAGTTNYEAVLQHIRGLRDHEVEDDRTRVWFPFDSNKPLSFKTIQNTLAKISKASNPGKR